MFAKYDKQFELKKKKKLLEVYENAERLQRTIQEYQELLYSAVREEEYEPKRESIKTLKR